LYTNIERVREEIGEKYRPVGATSMTCTFVDLGFSESTSEILLVIDFYLKYVLCSFGHRFIVLLSALVFVRPLD
jgi:hypothetical protein